MKTCPKCQLRYPDETTFCFVDGSTLEAANDDLQGTSLAGLFVIGEAIGQSGWARVHRAEHRLLRRPCIAKLLDGPVEDDQRAVWSDAVKMSRRLGHRHVAAPISGGVTAAGTAFAVSEPPGGSPLASALQRGALGVERSVRIVLQVLRGLSHIHDFGGFHGDLHPGNVLLEEGDGVVLVDACLGRTRHRPVWEPSSEALRGQFYLAPELPDDLRAAAGATDPAQARPRVAADLYSVGMIMCAMLSGRPLVEATSVDALRQALGDPLPPGLGGALGDVPERLVEWVESLVQRHPDGRPADAHEALARLLPFCEQASIDTATVPPAPREATEPHLPEIFGRWPRYVEILAKMVQQGFPGGAPPQTASTLATIQGRVKDLEELAKQGQFHHGVLSDVHGRAREGRGRIAEQMEEFIQRAGEIRAELSPLQIAAERHVASVESLLSKVRELHREVIRWEGRSGFAEPYEELAQAYRDMAEVVDKWCSVRTAQRTCEGEAAEKEAALQDVDAQLAELRTALRVHESNVDSEIAASEQELSTLGERLDALEPELLDMATRMTAPLRAKPELSVCFQELERVSA